MNELNKILQLAEPLAQSMGYEILKAEMGAEHGNRVLRIYLDKADFQVTIDDCEQFSRALGTILDVEADLPGRYHLEISSPGLNRPLRLTKHFLAQLGKIIQVQTEAELEGRHNFKGTLLRVDADSEGDYIELRLPDRDCKIPVASIKKAHLDYFATEEVLKNVKRET